MDAINLTTPKNYGEMTEKQIRYVAALKVAGQSEKQIWIKCLIRFSGVKKVIRNDETYTFSLKGIKKPFVVSTSEVNYMAKKMDWLTKRYIGFSPLRKIGKYKACEELLRDTYFIQYLEAENFYQKYLFTKEESALYKLMTVLYQPGRKYNNDLNGKHADYFARKATEAEKLIVLMWFMGVKEYFARKFKYLFPRKSESDEDVNPIAPNMHEIMKNQIRMLTGGDVTKESQVLNSPTWSALGELDDKCRDAEELEKQMKKNN